MLTGAVMYSAYDCRPADVRATQSRSAASCLTPASSQVKFQYAPGEPWVSGHC